MTEATTPRYRYWGQHKPVALARPVETVQMAADKRATRIRLYGPIDSWGAPFGVAASEVAEALDAVGAGDVEMHLHSPGGEAFEGLAIMNLLRQHQGNVSVIVDGLAASAASIVAMGADTVTMVPGSQMMIHDAAALAIGQADDLREAAEMLDSISSNAADQYAAKSGKTPDEMRTAMKATTWFKAQQAVDAGLADAVLADGDPQIATAKAATASLTFDLSIFTASACDTAPKTADTATTAPADQPVTPPTDQKEAVTMTDIPTAGLVKALGLPSDADEDTILEAVEARVTASAAATPDLTDEAIASARGLKAEDVTAALDAAAKGKVAISPAKLATLEANAQLGAEARARQIRDDRDEAITAAQAAGKLGKSETEVKAWQDAWARDPEGTQTDLDELAVRFPVAAAPGRAGGADQSVKDEPMTEAEAKAIAAQTGVDYKELMSA